MEVDLLQAAVIAGHDGAAPGGRRELPQARGRDHVPEQQPLALGPGPRRRANACTGSALPVEPAVRRIDSPPSPAAISAVNSAVATTTTTTKSTGASRDREVRDAVLHPGTARARCEQWAIPQGPKRIFFLTHQIEIAVLK